MNTVESFGSRVMLIDEQGRNRGEMVPSEAIRLADEAGLDLVEVNRQDDVSVCKIMDKGKWDYEKKKKAKKNTHSNLHKKPLKEIKFRVNIDQHDQDTKINHVKKFLRKGHDVRLVVELRGREKRTPEMAQNKMNTLIECLDGLTKTSETKHSTGKRTMVSTIVQPKEVDE